MSDRPFLLSFPFTEGCIGKLQVWCRTFAFASGKQASICLKGRCSVDHVGPSDCCNCCCGEWPHDRLFGQRQRRGLQGWVLLWFFLLDIFFLSLNFYLREGVSREFKTSNFSYLLSFVYFVQVHLRPGEYGNEPYSYVGNNIGEKVNKNLFLDQSQSHLYITTEKRVCVYI